MSPRQQGDRRTFLKVLSGAVASLALAGIPKGTTRGRVGNEIRRRRLGSTGLEVSILGLGTATIGLSGMSRSEAERILNRALDAGINYIDTASSYGDAEEKIGRVMKSRRQEVVLATKSLEREKSAAAREIRRSLRRLQTEYVDLLQIHAVNYTRTLDRVLREDGSVAAALEAKEQGLVRHIGISGHRRPAVIASALERYPFATALIPLSAADKSFHDFEQGVFSIARSKNVGVIGMKVLVDGRITGHTEACLRYTMSLPISCAILGVGSMQELEEDLRIAQAFRWMSDEENLQVIEALQPRATAETLWWKR
ncbi:MAG: aldo/keto reductase [Bacteroidota bacterium]